MLAVSWRRFHEALSLQACRDEDNAAAWRLRGWADGDVDWVTPASCGRSWQSGTKRLWIAGHYRGVVLWQDRWRPKLIDPEWCELWMLQKSSGCMFAESPVSGLQQATWVTGVAGVAGGRSIHLLGEESSGHRNQKSLQSSAKLWLLL